MDQPPLIGVPPAPMPPTRRLLTELELQDVRKKLIESEGKIEVLGENAIELMRDVLYTCRMKANPMQEDPQAPKEKKVKGESTKREKLSGLDVNSLLG